MPKFNLNWLYMIIAMMLLGLYLTNESGTSSKNIPYDEFQEYVRNGYISKVTGYDDNSVEAYVKPQYVPNVFKADSSRVGKNPLITTEAPSRESLGDFLQKEKDETRFDGSISYEKKRNYFGAILWQILPVCFPFGFRVLPPPPLEWRRHGRRQWHFQCRQIQSTVVREKLSGKSNI